MGNLTPEETATLAARQLEANAKPVTVGDMFTLAKRLRTRAEWECRDGYYTDEAEAAKNGAMREIYENVAGEIDDLFNFDSSLTRTEKERRW